MDAKLTTREKLLLEGKNLFWSKGYSNVSVRQVAQAAGVDVALISRYFGSKLGLFDATLETIEGIDPTQIEDPEALVEMIVALFVEAPRPATQASAITMILMNAADHDVGARVRETFRANWQDALDAIIGDPAQAALFTATVMGMSVAEKTLLLEGIAHHESPEYADRLRGMLHAALDQPL